MVNKNSPGLFRKSKPRDRLISLVSWKRRYHKEALTLPLWLAPIGSLPCVCILQQCNSTPLLQAKGAYGDGPGPPPLLSVISNLSKSEEFYPQDSDLNTRKKLIWETNSAVGLGTDTHSFYLQHRGEKVRFLAKVNWLPVLKSTALTVWTPAHLGYSTPSAISTWHEQAEYLVGK